MTNSDCHTCYSNLVDCVFEDDCGYRGETSIRNLALWIKWNCEAPVIPTCAPCAQPVRVTPCPLLELSTPKPLVCVETEIVECPICDAVSCDICTELLDCPDKLPCPDQQVQLIETPKDCPVCPSSVVSSSAITNEPGSDCQRLLDQVVETKNTWISDFKICNNSLHEKNDEAKDLLDVSAKLSTCITGYSSCKASIASGAFQSILVNFTWSNETDHLRLDLSDCQSVLGKTTGKLDSCVNEAAEQDKECSRNIAKQENLVFSHSEDVRFVFYCLLGSL